MSSLYDTTKTPGHFRIAGKEFPEITWWKQKNLRNCYLLLLLAILTSATNGYDGSMVNGLLSLRQFKDCKFHVPEELIILLIGSKICTTPLDLS